jgi:hypothetical protein
MPYAKIKNDSIVIYPYSFDNLVEENPHTIFSNSPLPELYKETDFANDGSFVVEVIELQEPIVTDYRNIAELNSLPTFVDNLWCLEWSVRLRTDSELQQITEQEEMKNRLRRDQMLQSTDWTQLADTNELTKQNFASFRQDLRDVPQQEGFPWNIVWPELNPRISEALL